MRLYVGCHRCRAKVYLSEVVESRYELPNYFELTCTSCGRMSFHRNSDVVADAGFPASVGGATLGGLIGLLGGPLGLLLGAMAGGALGAGADGEEQKKIRRFNES